MLKINTTQVSTLQRVDVDDDVVVLESYELN